MSHAYIAHAPEDLDALLEVHEALRQAGIGDWYPPVDRRTLGENVIDRQIDQAFVMILLVSATAMRDRGVRADVERARASGLKIVPFRTDKSRLHGPIKSALESVLTRDASEDASLSALIGEVQAHYRQRCPVLAVMNLKGGVGKTTVTAQVFAAWQAMEGTRILLVDLDPQYNLTQVFFDMEDADRRSAEDRSVISLFEKSRLHATGMPSPATDWARLAREPFAAAPREAIAHPILPADGPAGRLDLISGQFELSKYAFATDPAALDAIRANFLAAIEFYRSQYDLIVFDTNPNATFLTRCCLEAADRVVAPMHPDIYSLRGVRLLNQVVESHIDPHRRPAMSVLFNTVGRREQSDFEADARNGIYDQSAGFALSKALLGAALPRSGHLVVKAPDPEAELWRQLVVHSGRGGGLKLIRESLNAIASELAALNTSPAERRAA